MIMCFVCLFVWCYFCRFFLGEYLNFRIVTQNILDTTQFFYRSIQYHVIWHILQYCMQLSKIDMKYALLYKSLKMPRGNQNPYIEEEQTTQWPKEKVQKDKQPSTKHTYKTKDRVTRTPIKTGGRET